MRLSPKMDSISDAVSCGMPLFWVRSKCNNLVFRFNIFMTSIRAQFVIPFALKSIHKMPASSSSASAITFSPLSRSAFCDKSTAVNPIRFGSKLPSFHLDAL